MTGEPGAHREYPRPLLSYSPLVYIKACASQGQRSLLLLLRNRGVCLHWWRAQACWGAPFFSLQDSHRMEPKEVVYSVSG